MFLLDTNACIAVINGKPHSVRVRLQKEFQAQARVFVPAVVAFELWYGVAKSARADANGQLLTTFLAGPLELLAFDDEDAKIAGAVRANLEAAGKPIGAYDLLIAGQALRHKLTLVTANSREFGRVKGLEWEDWGKV
ncbi:tRNA(fMet)-specific endonuclease VapC [Candidatus Sulfotelmatobacter sp. SbA7]|jgi:tRNA(fMet)-specific endonuclease VapC|nr:tRNA(fMet)-specific endonuclease VapC [Candidatus Sulfotelmatobacter sp. SbA7]